MLLYDHEQTTWYAMIWTWPDNWYAIDMLLYDHGQKLNMLLYDHDQMLNVLLYDHELYYYMTRHLICYDMTMTKNLILVCILWAWLDT
jgi:hypothetical protein